MSDGITEPKFRIGDIVYAPKHRYRLCFKVTGRMWSYDSWLYFGSTDRFVAFEAELVGPRSAGAVEYLDPEV